MFLSGIQSKDKKMSKLWGGRFSKETNKMVESFTKSIHFDYKLAWYDLLGSIAHMEILHKEGFLSKEEASSLSKALDNIINVLKEKESKGEAFPFDPDSEDIHTDIQKKVEKEVGSDLVLKLHTARSRNDQVVFATKMYTKMEILKVGNDILLLAQAITTLANKNDHLIIPGFTHLQHAQPIKLKDYLMAYCFMLERDDNRLNDLEKRIKINLGAGALAGTPISRDIYNSLATQFIKSNTLDISFKISATDNSLDAVSDRDFVIEAISALSIVAMHLSRLAEDLIIWSTKEFDFIEIDDAFCTGSSLMPQKKNPDVLELIRGYTGRLYGNLVSVLTMMKGLPLTYNRDMQLDKEPLFNSFEIVSSELRVLKGLIETLKFNEDKIKQHLNDESLYATDLVYYLVGKGVPFKEAHTIIGEMVRYSVEKNIQIKDLPDDVLKEKFCDKIIKSELIILFNPNVSVESKKSVKCDPDTLSKFKV
jgi:argininosuccinate lyase